MNLTIVKTRIRPSITVGPKCLHKQAEGRMVFKTQHQRIVSDKVSSLIFDYVAEMTNIWSRIDKGDVSDHEYEKTCYKRGNSYFKCAFVCHHIDRDDNKALYWLRKALACFDYEGSFVMENRNGCDDSIWLHTDIQKDSEWEIAAKVTSRSFLGITETHHRIGTIKEEPDLTPVAIRLGTFDKYVTMESKQRFSYK
jgi:hypothetical protein